MMRVSEFVRYLKLQFPDVNFYNGTIDRGKVKCVGVYSKGTAPNSVAIGGPENSSYGQLPISILVHWGEDSDLCEGTANAIYEKLRDSNNFMIGDRRVISIKLLDPCPTDISRDDNNICEMVIRAIIFYDRR